MPGITLTEEEVRKLTSCGNPDAAVLFLYRKAELPRETALAALHFTVPRMVGATDTLRQLGLWQEERPVHPTPERPQYTEEDLKREQQAGDGRFRNLVGEAQRRLGRTLSTEELKILLSLIDYLRLPTEVVGVLLYYCLERSRRRDSRAPSMRAIEKEAYRWADEGIDTLETASFYVQQQLRLHPRPPAGGVSAIGGDHIVLRTGPFLQPVKISCAENIARHIRHLCSFVSSSGS